MGILDRISAILHANHNDNLNRAANPEIALAQMLQEMEAAIQEARSHLAELQTIERQLESEKLKYLREARDWGLRAERAVAAFHEDIAREALQRRKQAENAAAAYQKQWEDQHAVVKQFQEQLKTLIQRYEDTKRNRTLLLTRQRTAFTQQRINQVLQNAQQLDPHTPAGQLDSQVRRLEAETQAQAEVSRLSRTLDEQLADLEKQHSTEQELEILRHLYQEPPVPNNLAPGQLPPPPTERQLWFADSPPPAKQDFWFSPVATTETSETSQAPAPQAQEIWFDETSPPTQPEPWFEETSSEATRETTPAAQEYWFEDEPPQIKEDSPASESPQSKAKKEYWFES